MPTQPTAKELERRREVDDADSLLDGLYEQLHSALGGDEPHNQLGPGSGAQNTKLANDRSLQKFNKILAHGGKETLTSRASKDIEHGEGVGIAYKRHADEALANKQELQPTEIETAMGPVLMTPKAQEEAGIQSRATVGGLVEGDTRNEQIRRIANERAKNMARGGAAPGLTGATVSELPDPGDEPKAPAKKKTLDPGAVAKEQAIRDYMETLGVDRETAIAMWEKNRAKSDRPTG